MELKEIIPGINKDYVDRIATGLTWKNPVLDKDLSSPPASPSEGDRYIVGKSPTGNWSGHENDIAEYDGSSWAFHTASEGWAVIITDEDNAYNFNGSKWAQITGVVEGTSTVTTQSMTIYIDADSGSDDTGDGSSGSPYKTLQYAWDSIPNIIAHDVTFILKSATAQYESADIKNKFYVDPDAQVTVKGQTTTLDSGTLSSANTDQNDMEYGADVQVATISDTSRSWTTDEHQYKLLRVWKDGVDEYWRIIVNNDADTLYVAGNWGFKQSDTYVESEHDIPDSTWSYEILDWDSKIKNVRVSSIAGEIKFKKLWFEDDVVSAPAFVFASEATNFLWIIGCKVTSSVDNYGFDVQNDFNIRASYLKGGNTGSRDAVRFRGSARGSLLYTVVNGWGRGIRVGDFAYILPRGSRFENMGSTVGVPIQKASGAGLLYNDGSWGTVLLEFNASYSDSAQNIAGPRALIKLAYDLHYANHTTEKDAEYWSRSGDNYPLDAPIVFNGDTKIERSVANTVNIPDRLKINWTSTAVNSEDRALDVKTETVNETDISYAGYFQTDYNPANPPSGSVGARGFWGRVQTPVGSSMDFSNATLMGASGASYHQGNGILGNANGFVGAVKSMGSGTIENGKAVRSSIVVDTGATITDGKHFEVSTPLVDGTLTNQYGFYIHDMVDGVDNYPIYFAGRGEGGKISWLGDTNLYSPSANNLKTDDNFQAGGYKSSDGSAGASGTFTAGSGEAITVKDGLITSIV